MPVPATILSIGGICAGAVLLVFSIVQTLHTVRSAVVARLAVLPQQSLRFAAAGPYELQIEQPRFFSTLAGARFALEDAAGRELRSWPVIFRTYSSGISTARLSVRGFEVPDPGDYRLNLSGIKADADVSRCALVFVRPYGAVLFLGILGIVLGAALLLGGIVFTSLIATGKLAL